MEYKGIKFDRHLTDRQILAAAAGAVLADAPWGFGWRQLKLAIDGDNEAIGRSLISRVAAPFDPWGIDLWGFARTVGDGARDVARSAQSLRTARAASYLARAADQCEASYASGVNAARCECMATVFAAASLHALR